MNLKTRSRRLSAIVVLGLLAIIGLSGCTTAASSTAMCAFIAGDGEDGEDANLHEVVYPGQNVDYNSETEVVSYVPCNSRNYITNDGGVKNANDQRVGDRFEPTEAYLADGTQILVWTTAYWTLNQSRDAMDNFYAVCYKYSCASDEDSGGSANFSTEGWNGMLGEDFGPAIDRAARLGAINATAAIWETNSQEQYDALGEAMTAEFQAIVRNVTGYSEDLFCGSGNSGWDNPDKPGEGEFTCSQVRIVVDKVELGSTTNNAAGTAAVNNQRLAAAQAIYGDNAGYWLAVMDAIKACKDAGVACTFGLGDPGTIPGATPVPATN